MSDQAPTLPREQAFPALAPRVTSEFRASLLQIPIFGDEHLLYQFVNLNTTTPVQVGIIGRLWSDQTREVKYFSDLQTMVAGGSVAQTFTLERGALLTLAARVATDNIQLGEVWGRVLLTKGRTGAVTFPATVLQGYIGTFNDLAWPGSPIQDLHEGKGVIRYRTWTQFSPSILEITVPADRRWRILTGQVVLITDANPGNRLVEVQIEHAGNVVFAAEASPPHPANTSRSYNLQPSITASAQMSVNSHAVGFVPDLEVVGGDIVRMRADEGTLFSAGDTFQGRSLTVREWFDQD